MRQKETKKIKETKEIGEKADDKVAEFWHHDPKLLLKNFYNNYDYTTFWKGREYENAADCIATERLIRKIPYPHRKIIDIGCGYGRMSPLYENLWSRAVLLDLSETQLAYAKKSVNLPEKFDFVKGSAESIPLPSGSCDTALCIRVFLYITDPRRAIKEISRVLSFNGYLILEIPNKIHAKARLEALIARRSISSRDPIWRSKNRDVPFLNHHPGAIQDILLTEGFEIIDTLSVSNFRHEFFKRMVPLPILLFFEKLLQRPLARMWFGPSIYFLARKKKGVR